ncbi:chemotaxis protein [Skermanella mucosa]|uniref:chemotaxis protein n=1 Tax=Skermanella mucosa TaxID=1789672 RepID=UPI00192BA4B9|nr:chemotaxis protein [Skermanella mucosa]UEM18879.1 chemotaxis protein [Skermanella mucosa]
MQLTEAESDAIIELFNLGMGRAAGALGQMVDAEVALSVPSLDIVRRTDAPDQLGCPAGQRICAVRQTFAGPFDGQAMLIFPEGSSLELVRRLLPDSPPLGDMTDLEEEALTEVGNVILNHCLASFANLLHSEIRTEIPVYQIGRPEEIIGTAAGTTVSSYVLIIRVDFGLFAKRIEGHVLFLQDIASIQAFQAAIRAFVASMDA